MALDVLDYENIMVKTPSNVSCHKNVVETPVKAKFIEGFTPQQREEFDRGISIEDYAREKGIIIL